VPAVDKYDPIDQCVLRWIDAPRVTDDELLRILHTYVLERGQPAPTHDPIDRLVAEILYWQDMHDTHCAHGPNCRAHGTEQKD